ncbi:MAG: M20 family metallopeptidase [Clostridia bacterium]
MDVKTYIDDNKELFIEINDKVWEFAETRFEEYQSAEFLCEKLSEAGFKVEKNLADMETAFVAEYGKGKPIIGILGEYDALSGLSQVGGIAEQKAIKKGEPGHGCGHNCFAAATVASVMAIKEYLIENNTEGTIRYYGCPAEEGGSGKAYMARAGLFDDLDVALTWHPGGINAVMSMSSLANYQVYYRFFGKAAHAAGSPHLGRSALDALELMNVGVNFLREHVIPEARMHYAILNTGGTAPNVVQAEAEALYLLRAPDLDYVREMYERVNNIAKGAALMTGTELEIVFDKACSNMIPNHSLGKLLLKNLEDVVLDVKYTKEEIEFSDKIKETFPSGSDPLKKLKEHLEGEDKEIIRKLEGKSLCDIVVPYIKYDAPMSGSTDVGDVSWVAPTAQFNAACYAIGTPGHSWQSVSQNKTSVAHKGVLIAGKTLALTAIELFENDELIKKAKEEFDLTMDGKEYECPIPEDVKPAIHR